MKRFVIALAAFLIPASASASDWWLGGAGNTLMVFIDRESIAKTGNKVKFWKHMFRKVAKDGIDSAKVQTLIDCSERAEAYQFMLTFKGEDVVDSWRQSGIFDPVPPDSVAETTLKYVCSGDWSRSLKFDDPQSEADRWRKERQERPCAT